jgi:hypothetical protein
MVVTTSDEVNVSSAETGAPRLVTTIVCAFSGDLPTSWLAVFHRFQRRILKTGLRIRVRLFAIEELPERFEILVVPPELAQRAASLGTGARVISTTREEVGGVVDALVREITDGRSLYAEPVRPGEPKIVTHRGMDEL